MVDIAFPIDHGHSMTVFVFVLVFVMPSGDLQIATRIVPSCPSDQKVVELTTELKSKGLIKGFHAQCALFTVQPPLNI